MTLEVKKLLAANTQCNIMASLLGDEGNTNYSGSAVSGDIHNVER